MKISLLAALLCTACLTFTGAAARAATEGDWQTDYQKALETAKAEHKLVLMDFTGSDWCIWCKRLDGEVFSKPEFQEYAQKNLVLLKVDFPQHTALPSNVKAQNDKLAQEFHIEGFPTVIVLNGEGKKVGELGYMEGGPSAFVAKLKGLPQG